MEKHSTDFTRQRIRVYRAHDDMLAVIHTTYITTSAKRNEIHTLLAVGESADVLDTEAFERHQIACGNMPYDTAYVHDTESVSYRGIIVDHNTTWLHRLIEPLRSDDWAMQLSITSKKQLDVIPLVTTLI